MEDCSDFIQLLGADMSMQILMCLEDPSDLVRVSSVSSTWRQYVIANRLCKQLCLRKFPEMPSVEHVIQVHNMIEPVEVMSDSLEWAYLERDHKVYAFLARGLSSFTRADCIVDAISASSTDNYPEENIQNTLVASDLLLERFSYWSSKGENDTAVPEKLIYKLIANLCVITEIHVQPFQAYFQLGFPIYSPKAVRFRMGHPKFPITVEGDSEDEYSAMNLGLADDKFAWTYTSPVFPMAQENRLQKFKLPEPVLSLGGILQIELLGRVQRQEMDDLYYICISHVQVVGRPLLPTFDVEVLDCSGKYLLKYCREDDVTDSPSISGEEAET